MKWLIQLPWKKVAKDLGRQMVGELGAAHVRMQDGNHNQQAIAPAVLSARSLFPGAVTPTSCQFGESRACQPDRLSFGQTPGVFRSDALR
jgi:hypothetical protein